MHVELFWEICRKNQGKIIGTILGLLIGIIIIVLGVLKGLFIILCAIIGYYIGKIVDNKDSIGRILDRILPPGIR